MGLRRRNRNCTRNTTSRDQGTILAARGHYERSSGLALDIGLRTKVTPLGPRSHRKTEQIQASAPIATVTKGTARLQKQRQEIKHKASWEKRTEGTYAIRIIFTYHRGGTTPTGRRTHKDGIDHGRHNRRRLDARTFRWGEESRSERSRGRTGWLGPLTGCPRKGGIGLARIARSTRRILTTVTTRRKRVGHIRKNGVQRVERFGDTKGPLYSRENGW